MAKLYVLILLVLGSYLLTSAVPVIDGPSRIVFVPENSDIGTEVLEVTATDVDGETFTFHIDPPSSDVSIPDSTTGIVTLSISPDREASPGGLLFTVVVRDTSGANQDSVDVTLALVDENDSPPVWGNDPGAPLSVSEALDIGDAVFYLVVTDDDLGSNAEIRYTLASPLDGTFDVNPESGVITLERSLDFDASPSYTIVVIAEDQGVPPMSAEISLSVSVTFELDNAPTFAQTHYAVDIDEGSYTMPTSVFTVTALDFNDLFASIFYQQVMRGEASDSLFSVDSSTGIISAVAELDRELVDSYTINIQAYKVSSDQSTVRSKVSVATVVFSLQDINDNAPVWVNEHTDAFSLLENLPVGTVIYTLFATDKDQGSNGDFEYILQSPVTGPFSVGSLSGAITLSRTLDVDDADSYTIVIRLQDRGTPQRSTDIAITVDVIHVLDPPPIFSQSIYAASIPERDYATTNEYILTVSAVDPVNSMATIRYEVISSAMTTLFTVNPLGVSAGDVTAVGLLDRESTTTRYTIIIQAFRVNSNGDMRSGVAITSVVITVLDANDNPPVWVNPIAGSISLDEDAQIGTVLYTLIVTDADEGDNAALTYAITSPTDGTYSVFAGTVLLSGPLDADVTPTQDVQITVTDGGIPSNSITISLPVVINVVPDPPPVFTRDVFSVSQQEGDFSTSGVDIVLLAVVDAAPVGEAILFSLLPRGDSSDTLFSVDSTSGQIRFTGVLDREGTVRYTLTAQAFTVDAADSTVVKSEPTFATVVVTVTDVNDNPPRFLSSHYSGTLAESARSGDIAVAGIDAFDLDQGINAVFEFGFADPSTTVPFAIDTATGVITVSGDVDYEMVQSYAFQIRVIETLTTEALQSTASVQIDISNVNDNTPSFAMTQYEFDVTEEETTQPQALTSTSPTGLMMMIQAVDNDLGVFGQIVYSLVGFETGTLFSVDNNGQISTIAPLDREMRDTYFFTLIAKDGGGTSALQATTLIVIRVTDINDQTPMFDPSAYTALLVEHVDYPSFLTVRATDGDMMGSPNSQIQYGIEFSDGSDASMYFTIDGTSGAISAQNLDFETLSSYSLNILAVDMGTVPSSLTGMATLQVDIQETNDLSPVFMPVNYQVAIDEDHTVGQPIGITVTATDTEGHSIQYFGHTVDADSAFFLVEASSGVISLGHALDYDPPNNNRVLSFRVLAVDNGAPPLTSTATVMVNVNDVNDNAPIISDLPTTDFTIAEGAGSSVPRLVVSIVASDLDGDMLTYDIDPPSTFFSVSSTGDVEHIMELDRLMAATHTLNIRACDGRVVELCDSVQIRITVEDYNNFAPVFASLTLSTTISECDATDHVPVTTITATDTSDTGANAEVEYTAVAGDISQFMLEPATGIVRIAPGTTIDFESGITTYTLVVRATDNPSGSPQLSAPVDATFTLTVADCNDNPPVFDRGTSGYAFTVSERTVASGSNEVVFGDIMIVDGDVTAANQVQNFQLLNGVASTNGWFDIDTDTGEIFIRSGEIVDREASFVQINSQGEGVISFAILVTNTASTGTFTATTMVTVTITDVDDNSPVIDQQTPREVTVIEHAVNGSIVAVITASDADFGDNEMVFFGISAGNEAGKFQIDPVSGVLSVAGDLDEEGVNLYTLIVTASNDLAVNPTAPDMITVLVTVVESNDFSPVFDEVSYMVTVTEFDELLNQTGVATDATVATVHATDQDGMETAAGRIEYLISSGNFLGNIQIFDIPIPSQGAVTVLRPDLINYETHRQFDLVVVAHDLILPENDRGQGSTHLVITVVDVNDNVPIFADAFYTGTVREALPAGSSVTVSPTIRGIDADQIGEEPLTFSFASGAQFNISADGALVQTTAELDRETEDFYIITLQVQDMGGHMSTAILNITLEDFNDNPPVFLETPADLAIEIPENLAVFGDPESSVVRTVTALDADIDDNAVFIFTLSGDLGYFDIGIETGEIILIQSLNREFIPEYILTVTATDAGLPTLSSSITFVVTIANINDNNPVFVMPVFEGIISEDAVIGVETGTVVVATDLDPDTTVTYQLVLGTTSLFDVRETGEIFTTASLDREVRDLHTFMVQATDGFRNSTDNALVEIMVTDANDESPVFDETSYSANVSELTPANSIILIVHANDADIGTNAQIEYTIASVDPPISTGFFGIGDENGTIFTNREVIINPTDPTTITLSVRATDKGPFPNFDTVSVFLSLVDRNLNAPLFEQPHYNLSVAENQANSLVGIVRATEPTGDLNPQIGYVILLTTRDGVDNFRIDQMGNIYTLSGLNREERDLFTFSIAAEDNDDAMPRTGYATVTVYVVDENDNDPFFDPDSYPIAISESTGVNSTVIRLFAFDDDIGSNADLTFQIASGANGAFAIDNNGVLTTTQELDRETVPVYAMIIIARDSGAGARQGMANVTITINDENDNSPVFTSGAVVGSGVIQLPEDSPPGTPVTVIQAADDDFQLNRIVVYTFANLTLSSGPFRINSATGEIVLQDSLDREEEDSYDLTILASDQRGIGPQVRVTSGSFTVNVQDVNDNVPRFINPLYEFEISEAYPLNTVFGQVVADDADIGSNAIPYYHIIGDSTDNTTCSNQFCVNLETGELFLVSTLDRETRDNHLITVATSNNQELTFNETTGTPEEANTGSVSVIVTDFNDRQPVFVESTLLAVIAEEAPFGTTITILLATDEDTLNGSIVYYEIVTPQVPYLVDRDTGVVTTAGVFRGLTGTQYEVIVRAFDNFGIPPTFSTSAIMEVQVFKTTEQVILTFNLPKEDIEVKISRIERVLVEVTQARITITEVRVKQTDDGSVDIAATDVVFFALDTLNGDVLSPSGIIRIIDENYNIVEEVFTDCQIEQIRVHPEIVSNASTVIPVWLWPVLAVLVVLILCMCCCFLFGCVIERRRSRRWKKKAALGSYQSQTDQFSSQMTDFTNPYNNPLWIAPYDNDETSTEISSGTDADRDNPLYESQELTIEMFQDGGDDPFSSNENLLHEKAPLPSASTPYHKAGGYGRKPKKHFDSEEELLAQAVGDVDDLDSQTSYID